MPVSAGTAYVDILARLDKLEGQITSGVRKSVGEAEGKLAGRFSAFGKNMGRNLLAGVGITFAAAGLIKFIGSSVQAAQEAEQSQLKLNQAFKIFPALANVNIESLRKLNTQMSFKTKFDDDALASGQAVLAQFKLTGQQIQEITPLLADYAAKTGMDIPSAATALGRAFLGNTRALKTIGINFKATGNTAKDYTTIIGLLREKVGGFAEAEGKTFSGRLEILKTQFGEVKEAIGRAILPILSSLATVVVKDIIPRIYQFGTLLKETFGPVFASIISTAKLFLPILKDIGAVVGITLVGALKLLALILKPLAPVISAVGVALVTAFVATKVTVGIQAILSGIKALAALAAEPLFGKAFMAGLTTETSAAAGSFAKLKASMVAAIGPMLLLTGAVVAIVASYKAIRRAQELVKQANKATADSFLKDTIPALLKTGGALQITAEQWRSGPFGGSDIIKVRKVFEELSKGSTTITQAFKELKKIAGVTQDAIDGVVRSQIKSLATDAVVTRDFKGLGIAIITAFRAAGTSTTELGKSLRDLSQKDLYILFQQLSKAGIPAEALATIFQTATGKANDLAGAANQVADAMEKTAGKVLNMRAVDLAKWEQQTTSNLNFVKASLSDLAGQANLTSMQILRSFDQQLTNLANYNRNFQRLINRHLPDDFLKQLADMGQQGAGIVAALASANSRDFQRIIDKWNAGRRGAYGVASSVESMAARVNKATASIANRRRTFLLDLLVTPELQKLIAQTGRGAVYKGELLRYQEGGYVPGPLGAPQLAIVHGGERVLTPAQQIHNMNTTGDTYNVNITTTEKRTVSDLGAFLRRRQLLRAP